MPIKSTVLDLSLVSCLVVCRGAQDNTYFSADAGEDGEEVDMEAERDLASDAQWKRIQQNTFTRWANEHLKIIDQTILNLETDLSDGLRLIALIEVLSQKRMPKHNKRPTFRSQKLENVSVALKFLEDEGIKIINIGELSCVHTGGQRCDGGCESGIYIHCCCDWKEGDDDDDDSDDDVVSKMT